MDRTLKISIALNVILIILAGIFGSMTIAYHEKNVYLEEKLIQLDKKISILEKQLSYYSSLSKYINIGGTLNGTYKVEGSIEFHAVAVAEQGNGYKGVVLNFTISLIPGNGRVLVNTQPRIGIDLQTSIQIAKNVAENITGISLNNEDIILSIEAPEEVDIVDGPSAGAAITAALVSLILNKTINQSVYMTGTISPDGSIGLVGGVLEKAVAAAEDGAKIFIVPAGEENITIYVRHEQEVLPGVYVITYTPEKINLKEYLESKGFHVRVIGVSHIQDIFKYIW